MVYMALIEIDGLPSYKMVDLSMAMYGSRINNDPTESHHHLVFWAHFVRRRVRIRAMSMGRIIYPRSEMENNKCSKPSTSLYIYIYIYHVHIMC